MQADLEKVSQQKFNFFHKRKVRPNLITVDMVGPVLIAASVIFGFFHRAEQRVNVEEVKVEALGGTEVKKISYVNYAPILFSLKQIEFDKNPEKLKKEIWDKFAVSAHFAYITKDSAEIGFTYKGENFTANINKNKEETTLSVPSKKYVVFEKNGRAEIMDQ